MCESGLLRRAGEAKHFLTNLDPFSLENGDPREESRRDQLQVTSVTSYKLQTVTCLQGGWRRQALVS